MFLAKNNSTSVTRNYPQSTRNNFGFSCGTKINNVNNSRLLPTKSAVSTTSNLKTSNSTTSNLKTSTPKTVSSVTSKKSGSKRTEDNRETMNSVFKALSVQLNNQLNTNIKTINRDSKKMFPKRIGCGCGGKR